MWVNQPTSRGRNSSMFPPGRFCTFCFILSASPPHSELFNRSDFDGEEIKIRFHRVQKLLILKRGNKNNKLFESLSKVNKWTPVATADLYCNFIDKEGPTPVAVATKHQTCWRNLILIPLRSRLFRFCASVSLHPGVCRKLWRRVSVGYNKQTKTIHRVLQGFNSFMRI